MPLTHSCFDFIGGSSMRWPGVTYRVQWVLTCAFAFGAMQSMILTVLGNIWHILPDRATCLATREGSLTVMQDYPVVYADIERPESIVPISGGRRYITVVFITIISPVVLALTVLSLLGFHRRIGVKNRNAIFISAMLLAGYIGLAWQLAEMRIDGFGVTESHRWCWRSHKDFGDLWSLSDFRKRAVEYGITMCALVAVSLALYLGLSILAVVINRRSAQLEARVVHMEDLGRSADDVESGQRPVVVPDESSVTVVDTSAATDSVSTESRSGVTLPETAVKTNESRPGALPLPVAQPGALGLRAMDGRQHNAEV